MAAIQGLSHKQSKFLRSFRLTPYGPPPDAWPPPAVLRRWLRRPGFKMAFQSLQTALKSRIAFQSLASGLAAAESLHDTLTAPNQHALASSPAPEETSDAEAKAATADTHADADAAAAAPADPPSTKSQIEIQKVKVRLASDLLRFAHARLTRPPRRLPKPPVEEKPIEVETVEQWAMRIKHPDCPPGVAIFFVFKKLADIGIAPDGITPIVEWCARYGIPYPPPQFEEYCQRPAPEPTSQPRPFDD